MSHNTWIHRIVRVGVRPLVPTAVSPNHITRLRLILGVAAAGGAGTVACQSPADGPATAPVSRQS